MTGAVLDASLQTSATVRVRATDRSGFTIESPLTITIVEFNNPPTDLTLSGLSLTLNSNDPAGTLLGTLATEDLDIGETTPLFPSLRSKPRQSFSASATSGASSMTTATQGVFGRAWPSMIPSGNQAMAASVTVIPQRPWLTPDPIPPTGISLPISAGLSKLPTPGTYEGYRLLVQRDDGIAVLPQRNRSRKRQPSRSFRRFHRLLPLRSVMTMKQPPSSSTSPLKISLRATTFWLRKSTKCLPAAVTSISTSPSSG